MRRPLKTAFLWVLLIALPTQGVVSAAMLFCESAHLSSPVSASDAHHHDNHHAGIRDAHSAGVTHDHEHGHTHKHSSSKCAGCTPCCMGASIVSSLSGESTFPQSKAEPFILKSAAFPLFTTDGPDRPPRPILA